MTPPVPMYVCVDVIVYHVPSDQFLMVKRKNDPFKGMYALPGGYVDPTETAKNAAYRELKEETDVSLFRDLTLLNEYSHPDRDPRGRVISLVYYIEVDAKPAVKAGDDAQDVVWMSCDETEMAFDHQFIMEDFLTK